MKNLRATTTTKVDSLTQALIEKKLLPETTSLVSKELKSERTRKYAELFGGNITEGNVAVFPDIMSHRYFLMWDKTCNKKYKETPLENRPEDILPGTIFIDTETTGLNEDDEIVEVGIIDEVGNKIFQSYFKPDVPMAQKACLCNGMTGKCLELEPKIAEKWEEIKKILENATQVVIFNAEFDLRMLKQTANRYRLPEIDLSDRPVNEGETPVPRVYDAFKRAIEVAGNGETWISLQNAAKFCGIDYEEVHSACEDAYLTLLLLKRFKEIEAEGKVTNVTNETVNECKSTRLRTKWFEGTKLQALKAIDALITKNAGLIKWIAFEGETSTNGTTGNWMFVYEEL